MTEVMDCDVSDANGVYKKDERFQGPYIKYGMKGTFAGDQVTFTFHRCSNRWFLSAFLANGGRNFLFSAAAEDTLKSPPMASSAWGKMDEEKTGRGSLIKLAILETARFPMQQPKNSFNSPPTGALIIEDTC